MLPPIDARLKVLIQECVEKWEQTLVEVEVMPDHVHLIVGCDPQFGIHKLVRYIKGSTSHDLRAEFPETQEEASLFVDKCVLCRHSRGRHHRNR